MPAGIDKLKQIQQLVQECLSEYQGEEDSEEPMGESDGMSESPIPPSSNMGAGGNDKIKMAVAMMKKGTK